MAVTARFLADFSSFNQAVDKAEAKLTDFTSGAARVEKALSRMTDSFSGRRVLQEATLMEKAVEGVGGVAKLTADDLKRVTSTTDAAIAKLKALGAEVPASLQKLSDEAAKAARASEGFGDKLKTVNGLLGGLGVGLSVGALVGFGKALLNDADALTKMRDRTGISIEGLQRLQVAGDDAGNTIDEMSSAINQFQNRLASGDKSAVGALDKLGVSLEEIQRMAPDQQFMAISEALRNVSDPAQQVALAMDLFGKTGAQVLPTLKRGFDDVKDAAVGMSTETAERLDSLGDSMQALARKTKGYSAEAFVSLMDFVSSAGSSTIASIQKDVRETEALIAQLQGMAQKAQGPGLFNQQAATSFVASEDEIRRAIAASEKAAAESARAHEKAEAEAKRHAAELKALAARWKELQQASQPYADTLETINTGTRETILAQAAMGADVRGLTDAYGLTASQADALSEALKFNALMAQAASAMHGKLATQVYNVDTAIEKLQGRARTRIPALESGPNAQLAALQVDDLGKKIEGAAQAFGILAQVSGDTFGGMSREIGLIVSQMNALQQSAQAFGVDLSNVNAGIISLGLNVIGYLAAAQAKEDQVRAAIGAMTQDAMQAYGEQASRLIGNTLTTAYIDAINHAHTLAEAQRAVNDLLAAMAAQQALINDANAVVGPSQTQLEDAATRAREILDLVTSAGQRDKNGNFTPDYTAEQQAKAYYNWQRAMADAGNEAAKAWVAAHDAADNATSSASKAIDELRAKRDGLAQSIANEAPEDVMGVIEAQIRGQIDALDAQMKAQQDAVDANASQATEAAQTIEDEFGGCWGRVGDDGKRTADEISDYFADLDVVVKVRYDYSGAGVPPQPNPIPMAAGGTGYVTKPTLFLAGEAGPEQFAFSGANKRFSGATSANDLSELKAELAALRQQQAETNTYFQSTFARDIARAVMAARATA